MGMTPVHALSGTALIEKDFYTRRSAAGIRVNFRFCSGHLNPTVSGAAGKRAART